MSDLPIKQVTRVDPETRELVVMGGLANDGDTGVLLGLLKSGVIITDHKGQRADIVDGHLKTVTCGGLPLHGYDAATAADTWQTIMATNRECHYAYMVCQTQDAIVSFDGGVSEHMYLTKAVPVGPLCGLTIPAGATICARNAAAGSNYALLHIFVW